ncbi:4-hydroxybenzoate octaprenyltransferase [Pseudoxanthobacter sp. M-2]|uniref:4-hydroxybenzoate octaprenyltransferase n=1 Tax=Pseudoxanthobacter sp. M-2 TaxID=3078754 RepID=UPI0038FD072C
MTDRAVADADRGNWVDRWAPLSWRPYARLARLDRPIGWWLLLWPCWWSAALAAVAAGAPYPNPWHLVLFLVGAIVMRGAGCTYNDVVDRDVDAQVTRTRSRPIPSGQVSAKRAFAFAVALSFVGLAVLLQFNLTTILVGAGSLVVVAAYPFAKRVTDWPQMVLGLAFSWGAFLGWTAVFGELALAPVALYLAAILWTIGYDTIYAHQDRRDDAIVGIRSTARLFGRYTKLSIGGLFVATVVALAVAFALVGAGWPAYVGLAAFAVHLAWQVITLDEDDPARCLMLFRSNRIAGWMPFLGLVADAGLRAAGVGG